MECQAWRWRRHGEDGAGDEELHGQDVCCCRHVLVLQQLRSDVDGMKVLIGGGCGSVDGFGRTLTTKLVLAMVLFVD